SYTSTLPCVSEIRHVPYPPNGKYVVDIDHNCNGIYNLRIQLISGQPSRADLFAGLTPNAFMNYTVPDGKGGYLYTIANPADGRGVIAVGSFTSRPLTPNSKAFTDLGLLAYFSSRGPTVDGRIKPDITAGGYYVYTAVEGSGYGYIAGTSFSAPVVAGMLSLLLEANPNLDVYEARNLLCRMAIRDSAVGDIPNNFFGCGKAHMADISTVQQPPAQQESGGGGGCQVGGPAYAWTYALVLVFVLLRRLTNLKGDGKGKHIG
ncbi:MAG: S8 family serine peptidase, partial [Aquificaceae bacterium]|nr:S8 family serine peptidase [Aquificaceae bacterium]